MWCITNVTGPSVNMIKVYIPNMISLSMNINRWAHLLVYILQCD